LSTTGIETTAVELEDDEYMYKQLGEELGLVDCVVAEPPVPTFAQQPGRAGMVTASKFSLNKELRLQSVVNVPGPAHTLKLLEPQSDRT
jgi:hypothetical protein